MSVEMTEQASSMGDVPPTWFWVASGLGLVWNLIGVAAFVGQMTMDLSTLSAAEQAFYESTPAWATVAFAVAVFGGVLGCVGLLLRKGWAFAMLVACLLGIVVQAGHSLFIGDGIEVFGSAVFILPLFTFAIAAALAGFARYSSQQGWI